jgi:CRP-like cAMP-binding protein
LRAAPVRLTLSLRSTLPAIPGHLVAEVGRPDSIQTGKSAEYRRIRGRTYCPGATIRASIFKIPFEVNFCPSVDQLSLCSVPISGHQKYGTVSNRVSILAQRRFLQDCILEETIMSSSTHEEKRQIFQRHFLLGKLSPNEIDALISYARVERYPAGREIFAKGSPGQCLMAVSRGSVKISSLSVGGKEIVFAIFNAGDIFGEIAVLDGEERSADATAMTECELLVLNRRDFLPVLEDHADLCMILLRILCRRLRQTTEQVEDVMFLHLESRIAKALLQLVESVGLRVLHSPSVELHVSQRELGNMAGGSRESVNKIFQNWHRRGLINLGKGSIMIHNVEAIEQLI